MKRFLPLLIPIIGLLISIPFLLAKDLIVPAKIAGVVLVLLTTFSLRAWLRRALRGKPALDAVKFNVNHRFFLNEISPVYRNMSNSEKRVLEKRMGRLLSDLQFDDTMRKELNAEEMLTYALFQIMVVYNEPYKSLKGLMIVFDQTNDSGELKILEDKYVLLNPNLLGKILKESQTLETFLASKLPVVEQIRNMYREF